MACQKNSDTTPADAVCGALSRCRCRCRAASLSLAPLALSLARAQRGRGRADAMGLVTSGAWLVKFAHGPAGPNGEKHDHGSLP